MKLSLFVLCAIIGVALANYHHEDHYDHYPKHLNIKHVWKKHYGGYGHGYGHGGGHGYGHDDHGYGHGDHYGHSKTLVGYSTRYQTMKHSKFIFPYLPFLISY